MSTCEAWTGMYRDGKAVACGKRAVAVSTDMASTTSTALCREHLQAAYGDLAGLFLDDGVSEPGRPDPNCYACRGTGFVQGFGHTGEPCPCLTGPREY